MHVNPGGRRESIQPFAVLAQIAARLVSLKSIGLELLDGWSDLALSGNGWSRLISAYRLSYFAMLQVLSRYLLKENKFLCTYIYTYFLDGGSHMSGIFSWIHSYDVEFCSLTLRSSRDERC